MKKKIFFFQRKNFNFCIDFFFRLKRQVWIEIKFKIEVRGSSLWDPKMKINFGKNFISKNFALLINELIVKISTLKSSSSINQKIIFSIFFECEQILSLNFLVKNWESSIKNFIKFHSLCSTMRLWTNKESFSFLSKNIAKCHKLFNFLSKRYLKLTKWDFIESIHENWLKAFCLKKTKDLSNQSIIYSFFYC